MSVTVVPIPGGRLLQHKGTKVGPHGMTNVRIQEVNMLKNRSTLAVSVPIGLNLSVKLGFISVNGPGETYFVDSPRTRN